MKFLSALIFFLFFFGFVCQAQKKKTFKINPGERIIDVIPQKELYTYKEFTDGTVYLKENKFSKVKMNYNSLIGEMEFINEKGDTLSIADADNINSIVINADTFYYDKGYLKLIANNGELKLANKQYFEFTNRQRIGAFGELSNASIATYDAVSSGNYYKNIVAKEIITLSKYSVFYFGDRFNHFMIANRSNLLEMCNKKQDRVKEYLKDNKVDFDKKEALEAMLIFLKK
ncbi:MAG: hypothetical protein M3Y85_12145 [Bacteroidota bacterium]|nr:hypothetical protein [Bacteroidota bacterium]